jgi:hypothetical protein
MLLQKYLPEYTYAEKHSVSINASAEKVFALADQLDFSGSLAIRFLFRLRGLPSRMLRKEGLNRNRFVELGKIQNQEIIIGLIGQFWKPTGNLQIFQATEFTAFSHPDFLKAVWNFTLTPESHSSVLLETETRIFCPNERTRIKFSRYWFFIRPFSGLIRKEILRSIKKKAESSPLG